LLPLGTNFESFLIQNWSPNLPKMGPKSIFLSIRYSLMPNLDFCNTSLSKTSFLRLLSLPKIIKFRSDWPFSHLQKCDHKTKQLQSPILMKFGSKRLPKLEDTFSFWGSEHHFLGFHFHICLQSDFLKMSKAKSLFWPPQGDLNCSQKSIKSMVPPLFFKIFSKRSSTWFLKDVPSKNITFGSNVRWKLKAKSCRQLQTASFAFRNQDFGWK